MAREPNPHEKHRERLTENFLENGLSALPPHVILELLLFFAIPRKDTNPLAHDLLRRYGSLRGVLEAGYDSLTDVEGIGKRSAALITLAGAIAREYDTSRFGGKQPRLASPEQAEKYVAGQIGKMTSERLLVVCLDAKGRIRREKVFAEGTASQAPFDRRAVMRFVLESGAVSVVIGHNHPNGSPLPSRRDVAEAERLKKTFDDHGVKLGNFIIVGDNNETYSLARSGLLC